MRIEMDAPQLLYFSTVNFHLPSVKQRIRISSQATGLLLSYCISLPPPPNKFRSGCNLGNQICANASEFVSSIQCINGTRCEKRPQTPKKREFIINCSCSELLTLLSEHKDASRKLIMERANAY